MPKYLLEANYTPQGMEGVRAKGAKSRLDAVSTMVAGMEGSLESFHFAFGDTDLFIIVELPDDEAAAAVALTVGSSGAASVSTTKLLTVDQVDEALRRSVEYHPPGT